MTPNYWEDVMNILIEKYELSKTDLWNLSIVVSKRTFWDYLKTWEEEDKISIRQVGKKSLVSLSSSDKGLKVFIKNFGIDLDNYEKQLKNNLQQLKNNLPLINPNKPMKVVKGMRRGVLELDKKDNHWRDLGKTEPDDSLRTWNCRKKPLQHFEAIMNILNRIYQQSTALNYNIGLNITTSLMKKYQKKSDKMINETINQIEDMFRGKTDFHYAITRLRATISGIIYQKTMKAEMDKARKTNLFH